MGDIHAVGYGVLASHRAVIALLLFCFSFGRYRHASDGVLQRTDMFNANLPKCLKMPAEYRVLFLGTCKPAAWGKFPFRHVLKARSPSEQGASKNRRERVKLAVTGLTNAGHVPSVRRAPELTDSPAQ